MGDDLEADSRLWPVRATRRGPSRRVVAIAFSLDGKLLGNFTAQANTPKGPEFAYLGAQDLYVGGDFTGVASAPNPTGGVAVYHKQPGLAIYHTCPSSAA